MDGDESRKNSNQRGRARGRGRAGRQHWRGRGRGGRGRGGKSKIGEKDCVEDCGSELMISSDDEEPSTEQPVSPCSCNKEISGGPEWQNKGPPQHQRRYTDQGQDVNEKYLRHWPDWHGVQDQFQHTDFPFYDQASDDFHFHHGRGRPPRRMNAPRRGLLGMYHSQVDISNNLADLSLLNADAFLARTGRGRGQIPQRGRPPYRGGLPRNEARMYGKGQFFSEEQLCSAAAAPNQHRGRGQGRGESRKRRGTPRNKNDSEMFEKEGFCGQDQLYGLVHSASREEMEHIEDHPNTLENETSSKARSQQSLQKGEKMDIQPKEPASADSRAQPILPQHGSKAGKKAQKSKPNKNADQQDILEEEQPPKAKPQKQGKKAGKDKCTEKQQEQQDILEEEHPPEAKPQKQGKKGRKDKKPKVSTSSSNETFTTFANFQKLDSGNDECTGKQQDTVSVNEVKEEESRGKLKKKQREVEQGRKTNNVAQKDNITKNAGGTVVTKQPDEVEVFNTLLKHFDGVTSVFSIYETGLFSEEWTPSGILFWFKSRPKKFITFTDLDEAASTVSVYYPGPKLCIGYLIPKGKCTENPCKYFHLCRNFSMGCCHFGENCRYSHDVKSPHNQRIVLQNGLDDFSDHEILRLIELSTPRVCRDYNQGGCKYGDACRRLHICSRLVRNSCLKSPEACFNHDKNSPQCKNILGAYHLQKNPNVFKFLYTEPEEGKTKVQKQPEHKRSYSGDIEPVMEEVAPGSVEELRSSHHVVENPPAKEEVKQPLMEDDSSCYSDPDITEICEAYLRGECYSTESCKRHHYQLPYLWQVLLDGNWISLDKDGTNQMIEQAFSRPECKDIQITSGCKVHSGGNTVVIRIIDFNTMKATLGLTVRRLSTPSYVQVKEAEKEEATVGNMTTQWRWYWQDNGYKTDRRGNLVENWMMYEQVDGGAPYQSVIELKFLHGQKKYIFQHGQFIYSLNMSKMYQKNWETGKMRAVVRRPLFFGSKCLASPSRHLPTILDEAPSHWFPIDTASDYEMIPLEESSVKYKETEKMFMGSIGNQHYEVKKVYQVQNPYQWHKYCSKKKFLLSKLGDNLNEKQLFHGSDSFEVIKAICKQNFDARVSGKNAVMYGEGCYFAKTAKYSNNYTDRNSHRQYMFLARVLVGMYVQGQKGWKRPPSVNPAKLESDLYNSCVDNTMSPSIFVIFDHDQSYPEYLIEYTCTQPDSEFSPLQLSNPYSSANFSSTSPVHVPPPAPARPNLPSDVYATHSSNVYAAGSSTPWQTTQSSQERFGQSPRQNRPNLHKTNTDKNCCIQ